MDLRRGHYSGSQTHQPPVVDVFLFAGQSNLDQGSGDVAHFETLDNDILIWDGSQFAVYEPGVNASTSAPLVNWGPEGEFAKRWRIDNPNRTCYIVKHSVGGTDLAVDWKQDGTGPEWNTFETYYNDAVAAIIADGKAVGNNVLCWMQGEADAGDPTQSAAYEANLTTFFDSVRTLCGENLKIVVGRIYYNSGFAHAETVRAAQKAVVDADNNSTLISTDNLSLKPSEVHYLNSDFVRLGEYFYQGYLDTYDYSVDDFYLTWGSNFTGGSVITSTTASTVIATLSASSTYVGGPHTYSVVSDPDSKVSISGSNLLLENTVSNGVTYNFTVRATNNLGYTADIASSITGSLSSPADTAWEDALDSLTTETDGFQLYALDTTIPRILIRDATTPANDYDGALFAKLTHPSPAAKWIRNSSGVLVNSIIPQCDHDNSNVALGMLIEASATNLCLWSDDLTQDVWVKSNTTAAMTATGPDGVANSATTITATAGNGTVLQTITSASATRVTSCYIKRRTGSGTVNITQDNGSTWTAVTVTGDWTRVNSTSGAVANPVVGLRLVTSGDAVDVAFFQNEANFYGQVTSPIRTDSLTTFRYKDEMSLSEAVTPRGDSTKFYFVAEMLVTNLGSRWFEMVGATGYCQSYAETSSHLIIVDGATIANIDGGTFNTGSVTRLAAGAETDNYAVSIGGATVVTDVSGTMMTGPFTKINFYSPIGGGQQINGWLRSFKYVARRPSNADLETESA